MEAFIFTLLFILWFISGAASFVYWWTKEFDFTWEEFPLMIFGGAFGPLCFIIGWLVCNGRILETKDRVLFKKRGES